MLIGRWSVWPSTSRIQLRSGGILGGNLFERGDDRVELLLGGTRQIGAARREQHFGLEHEAVADNPDVGPVAKNLSQTAEELGAITGQFLDLAGQRKV